MERKRIQEIKRKIPLILIKHKLSKAGVFSSYARDEEKVKSDVDILIMIGKYASLIDFVQIKLDLEDKIKKKVDLVEYKSIHPLIKNRVLCGEIRIL